MSEEAQIIKALPTHFDGITYRSRREARWAVFLTRTGLSFEYEPEGFNLDGVFYLPDFLIPDQPRFKGGFWLEVKGPVPSSNEKEKLGLLVAKTGIRGCIVNELPNATAYEGWTCYFPPRVYSEEQNEWIDEFGIPPGQWGEDMPYYFCHCSMCSQMGFEYSGWVDRVCGHGNKQDGAYHPDILNAFSTARNERFGV